MRHIILSLMLLLFATNSFAITIEDERDYEFQNQIQI